MKLPAHRGDRVPVARRFADNWVQYGQLAGLSFLALMVLGTIRLKNDVVWQLWIARQLLGGARLYSQIWEINPPLWFWSAVPVEWLAVRTGIAAPALLVAVIVGMAAGSAMLVDRLLEPPCQRQRLCLMALLFVAVLIVPLAETGQREQLTLITSLPYAALIARRHAGSATPVALAVTIGLIGAYGFALKHYFLTIPVGLELWLGWHLRRAWRPWRPELLVLMTAAVAYAGCILAFAPDYLTVMVPMVRTAYFALDAPPLVMLVRPPVLFWVTCAASLAVLRTGSRAATSATMAAGGRAMLIPTAGFALAYWFQHKGWGYHAIPVTGAMTVVVGMHMLRLRRRIPIATCAILIAWAVFSGHDALQQDAYTHTFIDRVPKGEAVFIGTTDPGVAWPAPERRHLIWVSRTYSLWPAVAIITAQDRGAVTPALHRLADTVVTATSQDIRCTPPWLIQIDRIGARPGDPEGLGLKNLLFRDEALRRFVADHYDPLPGTADAVAWQRRGHVAGMAGPLCRTIH